MGGSWSHDETCDGCQAHIQGYRHQCRQCKTVNFCSKCFESNSVLHEAGHVFDRMWQPDTRESSALPRTVGNQKIELPQPLGFGNLALLTQRREQLRALKQPMNILIFGERGVGKTAFINAAQSGCQDDKSTDLKFADKHGAGLHHQTQMVRRHAFDEKSPIRLWDVWGWSERKDFFDDAVLPFLLNGHLKDGFQFQHKSQLNKASPLWEAEPAFENRMHCVIVMTEPRTREAYAEHVRAFLKVIHERDIPYLLVVSKTDSIDAAVKQAPEHVYSSLLVQRALGTWRDTYLVDIRDVYPMKGYTFEHNRNKYIEQMALDIVFAASQQALLHIQKVQKYKQALAAGIDSKIDSTTPK
jgi:hypothetical protein